MTVEGPGKLAFVGHEMPIMGCQITVLNFFLVISLFLLK